MDKIREIYPQYFKDDPNFDSNTVFKSCGKHIVVLEKLFATVTNEDRTGIADPFYAKYRGNYFFVKLIFNKLNPTETIESVKNTFYDKVLEYITGNMITDNNFDGNIQKIDAAGIHYFRSIELAFSFQFAIGNYTGTLLYYYANGFKLQECDYLEGKKHGNFTNWYETGNIRSDVSYVNGLKHGKEIVVSFSGGWCRESIYENGIVVKRTDKFITNGKWG